MKDGMHSDALTLSKSCKTAYKVSIVSYHGGRAMTGLFAHPTLAEAEEFCTQLWIRVMCARYIASLQGFTISAAVSELC